MRYVPRILSSEKDVTISKVIPALSNLVSHIRKAKIESTHGNSMKASLLSGLAISFPDLKTIPQIKPQISTTIPTTTSTRINSKKTSTPSRNKHVHQQYFSELELITFALDPRYRQSMTVPIEVKKAADELLIQKYNKYSAIIKPKLDDMKYPLKHSMLSLIERHQQEERDFMDNLGW